MAQDKDVARLVLELSADVAKLDRGMRQGQRIAEQRTAAIEKSFDRMNQKTSRSVNAMSANIRTALGGLALAAAAREVQQYADTWTRSTNALRAGGSSVEEAGAKMDQLTAIALRSRSSLEGTVTLYNRLIAASGDLGVSQDRVARVVETVNKALATSNLSGSERASAVTQLAQGLGSGTLAGDELKAIRENSQVLSKAIADEFGVSIGQLKKLGEEGQLTSARVFKALEKATAGVDAAFAKTRGTIDDAFTNLTTKTIQFVGQLDASTGASQKLAAVIGFVANHLDEIALAAGVAAVAVGTGYATAMTIATARTVAATVSSVAYQVALIRLQARQTGATVAQVALNAALTANPIGLVVVAVAALAAGLVFLESQYGRAEVAARELNDVQSQTSGFLDRYRQAQFDAANATKENSKAALEHVEALKKEGAEIVNVARLNAQRRINEATQARREADRAIGANRDRQAGSGSRSFSNASIIQDQAAQRRAQTEINQAVDARKDAVAALQELRQFEAALAAPPPSTSVTSAATTEDAKKPKGPSAEDIARTRQLLTLQMAQERLEAQGRTYDAEQVQALIDKINLTKQLKDAGVENASETASAQVDAVRQAEAAERGRIAALERTKFFMDAAKEALEAYNEEQDRQLQVQIDLARIEGNGVVVRMLERELALRQAIKALGPNATPDQVARVRGDETMLNGADDKARYQEKGQDMARTFVDVIRSDDIGKELGDRFRQAAFDNIERVLGNLFSQMMSGGGGAGGTQGGIGGWLAAAGNLFGGGRAMGGPVKAGVTYRVNENTPNSEYFTPSQNGYVGNMPKPRAQKVQQNVNIRQGDLYLAGANGDAVIYGNVRRMMEQNRRQTLADVKAGAPAAQLEHQLLKS